MWKQIFAVTVMNLQSLPQRVAASLVVVIGVAGVVGVLVSVLGMATGLSRTLADTGDPSRAIVLHKAAGNEDFSNVDIAWVGPVEDAPGVLRDMDGKSVAAAERIVGVNLPKLLDGTEAGATLRGTTEAAFRVHPEWHLVAGRMFRPGLREIVVGSAAARQYSGLIVGRSIELSGTDWKVTGEFTSGGDSHDSEILADVHTLMSAFNWDQYSSVTVRLDSPASFTRFRAALLANPSLEIDVSREQDFYRGQAQQTAGLLFLVSNIIGAIMAIGATLTALNTLYAAVAARTGELATLRAIGFGPVGVIVSILTESLLLSLLGALLGAVIAWLLFNGNTLSTMGGRLGSQLAVRLLVGPGLVGVGVVWACAIAFLGGLLPAIRAARLPVAIALRPM